MPSSGIWHRLELVWTDVSEEHIASVFRVEYPRARNQAEQVAADTCSRNIGGGGDDGDDGDNNVLRNEKETVSEYCNFRSRISPNTLTLELYFRLTFECLNVLI
jgi:hypothetical protein